MAEGLPAERQPATTGLPCAAFTLIELLVAISILVIVSAMTVLLITTVTKAWQRATALSEDLHHGDYVIDQLVSALRAARYRGRSDGFLLEKGAGGAGGADVISWVKEGPELVGEESTLAKTFHRIRFTLARDSESDKFGAAFTAWGDEYLQPDNFDPDSLRPMVLSDRVVGFSCRVATNSADTGGLEWLDTWDESLPGGDNETNHIPRFVELTLYLEPLEKGGAPVEMRRLVDIPIASEGMK